MDPLCHSGLPFEEQRALFLDIVLADPLIGEALRRAAALALPDWLIVSGVLYNAVWNRLTGKPSGHGTKDIDLFYFDASDLSYEAEDGVIGAAEARFADLPVSVEIRNEARVHLWFEARFGGRYPQLSSSAQALGYFAARTHAVGLRLDAAGRPELFAPFGLDDIFSFRLTPNRVLDNRRTYEEKAARARQNWPQIELVPW
ncbi:MAG: nucleotidyltransferase family protein [Mesorhizobium sp.]|nr:nucleotidyltransferase family protein [Mesorhizobium sp.]MBN9242393.1 nucleotidyltransferase family protein [Mesorhizobium sp.]